MSLLRLFYTAQLLVVGQFKKNRNKYKNFLFKTKVKKFLQNNSCLSGSISYVVIWELGGFKWIFEKNAIFALGLNVRNIKTHFIICDGTSQACIQRGLECGESLEQWSLRCKNCHRAMVQTAQKYCQSFSSVGDHIASEKIDEFKEMSLKIDLRESLQFSFLGVNVGQLAWGSTNRYMKGFLVNMQDLTQEQEFVYRKYFYAALVNTYVAHEVLKKFKPLSILTSHGVYVDYAPPVFAAQFKKIQVLTWASGYASCLHYFTIPKGENKLDLRGVQDCIWTKIKVQSLSSLEKQKLETFISDRYFKEKSRDIVIYNKPQTVELLKKELGIKARRIICLFTHVNWDACFDLSSMIFESANQWVVESIRYMISNKSVHWIIRIHPGELVDGSLFTTDEIIKQHFSLLPDNITILWSNSKINTYGLYQLIDAGITIFGTVGVELPLFGKPIITAGLAHFSGKGFSLDAKTKEEYFHILANTHDIKPLTPFQVDLAQRYAYLYFIQRQIPLKMIKEEAHWGCLDLNKLHLLLPGKDVAFEAICRGIMEGKDVILNNSIN